MWVIDMSMKKSKFEISTNGFTEKQLRKAWNVDTLLRTASV